MLAQILVEAEAMRAQHATQAQAKPAQPRIVPASAERLRRAPSPWKKALPIAACLVVLLGVGMLALGSLEKGLNNLAVPQADMSQENNLAGSGLYDNGYPEEPYDRIDGTGSSETVILPPTGPIVDPPPSNTVLPPPSYLYYPIVEIPGRGTTSVVNPDNPELARANENLIGAFITQATAYSPDRTTSVSCMVFAYASTDLSCLAILYSSEMVYYLVLDPAQF